MFRSAIVAFVVVAGAVPALAQERDVATGPFPVMATMDRVTDHNDLNLSLAYVVFDDDLVDTGLRFDIGGEYLTPAGFGGYGQVPISYISGNDESDTTIGNFELGGLYVIPVSPGSKVVLRGGLSLPTGPQGDDFESLINVALTAPTRVADYANLSGEITWLRLGGSFLHRQGNVFLRADGGFDLPVHEDDGDADPLVRVNLGGGVQAGKATIAGELVTTGTTNDDATQQFQHTFAATVGFEAGSVRPYGALIIPLDDEVRDTINFIAMAGIEVLLTPR
jgi:hypothetical protein